MNNNIKEIVNKYRWCQGIRQYTNKHYFKDNTVYREIQSNIDVERACTHANNHIDTLGNFYPLHRDDITDLEKTVARYEIAVNKVISFAEHSTGNPFTYTADELQELIDNIYKFYEEIEKIRMRYHMQD